MKIFTRTIFIFSILWLVGSPFAFGQVRNKYSPYVKKEIYKQGWIDFNKNRKMDPYENPNLDIEIRIDDRFWQYKKIIMSFQHLNILQHTASLSVDGITVHAPIRKLHLTKCILFCSNHSG